MTNTSRTWRPALDVHREFCTTDPNGKLLGLKGNQNSLDNLLRKHGQLLERLDVIRHSPASNRTIADPDRFGLVVFELLTTGSPPEGTTTAAAA
ncbi:hypothetical protein [Paraburkholderia sp. HD33-4]|uniref:hypothetical protein n=1 Tax=Paraburkholderia sp. HD33-4 TaxID=2883242 RepID=UPI001F35F5BC|nr:hypothetical protein [Paraburkholderia sp. HD33-4]